MIKAEINKENKNQTITAKGNVPEIVNDVAVLINSLYTQFQAVDQVSAAVFRQGLEKLFIPDSRLWNTNGNQTGIAFTRPQEGEN